MADNDQEATGDYSEPQENGETVQENGDSHSQDDQNSHASEEAPQNDDQQDDEEDDDRPVVELFVKAAVDKMKNGSCPICHRYFMMFYILREHGLIDLVVTTFMPENPPKEVLEFTNGKRYPLVKVHKGVTANGISLVGSYDDTDEIENLLKQFRAEIVSTRNENVDEMEAEMKFDDLYKRFNGYIKNLKEDNPAPMIKILERVNDHLRSEDTKFMVSDELRRADCHLLPWLQHIRVAGKRIKGFEIPTDMTYLWRYLKNSYDTDAFRESCPADREIIFHYVDKIPGLLELLKKRAASAGEKMPQLMEDQRTFSVPEGALDH